MSDEIKKKVTIEGESSQIQRDFANVARTVGMVSTELSAASQRWTSVGKTMALTGAIFTAAVVVPLTALAKAAVDSAVQFEQAMANVRAVSATVGDEFERLNEQAMELGATTRYTATEAAEGMAMLGRAGWDAAETMEAMPGLLNLAAAGMIDLGRAADIVSDVMMAFGENADQAERYADVFAAAAANANTTVEALGQSMAYAAPSAATMGIAFEQTAAALAMFADAGIKGTRAGTTMDAMLRELRQNVTDGILDFEHFSVAVYDQQGNMRDFFDIMEEIFHGMSGLTQEQRDYAAGLVFSTRALRGFNVLQTTGVARMREMEATLMSAESAGEDMAETMMDTLGGSIIELNSAIDGVRISFGNIFIPVLTSVVNSITGLVRAFNLIPAPIKTVMVVLAAKTVAIILLTTVFGALLMVAGKLPPILASMAVRAKAAAVSMTAMAAATRANTAAQAGANVELFLMRAHFRVIARNLKVVLVNALRIAAAKMRAFAITIIPRMKMAFISLTQTFWNLTVTAIPALKLALATLIQKFWALYATVLPALQLGFAKFVQFIYGSFIPVIAKVGIALKAAIIANPILSAVAAIIAALVALSSYMNNQLRQDFNDFSEIVDEQTNEVINSFIEMDDEITHILRHMRHSTGRLSEEMLHTMTENMSTMAEQVLSSINHMKEKSIQSLEEMFAYTGYFSMEEQEAMLEQVEEFYNQQELLMIGFLNRLAELREEIAEQGYEATAEQMREMQMIQEKLMDGVIDAVTATAEEAEGIRQQMRAEEKARSAAHAAEMVEQEWDRHRRELIAIQATYEEGKQLVKARTDLTEQEMERKLAAYESFRNQARAEEKQLHAGIIADLQVFAGKYIAEIDWMTGEVKSLWARLRDIGRLTDPIGWYKALYDLVGPFYKLRIEAELLEAATQFLEWRFGLARNEAEALAKEQLGLADATREANDAMLEGQELVSEVDRLHRSLVSALKQHYEDIGREMTDAAINEEAMRLIVDRQQGAIIRHLRRWEPEYRNMGLSAAEQIVTGFEQPSWEDAISKALDPLKELEEEEKNRNEAVAEGEETTKRAAEAVEEYTEKTKEAQEASKSFGDYFKEWLPRLMLAFTGQGPLLIGIETFKRSMRELIEYFGKSGQEVNEVMEEALEVEDVMETAMQSAVDVLRSYEGEMYNASYSAFDAATRGALDGLQVASPSLIERIMMQIRDTSKQTIDDLTRDVSKLQSIAASTVKEYPSGNVVGTSAYEKISSYNYHTEEGAPTIRIENMSVRDDQDIDKIAQQLHRLGKERGRGVK